MLVLVGYLLRANLHSASRILDLPAMEEMPYSQLGYLVTVRISPYFCSACPR